MSYVPPNSWRAAMGYSEYEEPMSNPYDLPCEDCGHLASKHMTFNDPLSFKCLERDCDCVRVL